MKAIQVGLGGFGLSWLEKVLIPTKEVEIIGLVDVNKINLLEANKLIKLDDKYLFTSIDDALNSVEPDFILNVTPPNIHKIINSAAFKKNIPVLSEKPIAESFSDVKDIYAEAKNTKTTLIILENYRFKKVVRKTKEILDTKILGDLGSISIDFYRNHRTKNYHDKLQQPLLLDVAIHHFDMLRYLSDSEVTEVFAKGWQPSWSWYEGCSNADVLISMDNGISASYRGSLISPVNSTDWNGFWRISGSKGILEISGNEIIIKTEEINKSITIENADEDYKLMLSKIITALEEKKLFETDISDNLKTFYIAEAAIQSINKHKSIKIKDLEELI